MTDFANFPPPSQPRSGPFLLSEGAVVGGDFRILRGMKSGGMGALYLVEQLSTSRHRILKTLLLPLADDARTRMRFELEARVGAQVQSDHVVEVISAGVDSASGVPFLVMELLEGRDLAEELGIRRVFALESAVAVLRQIGHALAAAHRARIVHRDVKPENVFVLAQRRGDGALTVKLLDFGIAKVIQESPTTQSIGTPLYMAPELLGRPAHAYPCTDVWALALLAFKLLTGKDYWLSANDPQAPMAALLKEVLMDPIQAASSRARELAAMAPFPPSLDSWFARAMSRSLNERWTDAGVAIAALDESLGGSSPVGLPVPRSIAFQATAPDPISAGVARTVSGGIPVPAAFAPTANPSSLLETFPLTQGAPISITHVPRTVRKPRSRPFGMWAAIAGATVVAGISIGVWVGQKNDVSDAALFTDPSPSVTSSVSNSVPQTSSSVVNSPPVAAVSSTPTAPGPPIQPTMAASGSSVPNAAPKAEPTQVSRNRSASMDGYCRLTHPRQPHGYSFSAPDVESRRRAAQAAGCIGGSLVGVQFCCP